MTDTRDGANDSKNPKDPGQTADGAPHGHDEDEEGWDDRIRDTANAFRKAFGRRVRSVFNEDALKGAVSDAIPRELVAYLMKQADAAKDEVVRISGNQIRKFLENLDIGGELQKVLTSVSFEIRTTVRFVPNDKGTVAIVKPDSEVEVSVKQGDREAAVKAAPGKVKAMREGLRGAVDSAIKTLAGDEEDEGEVRRRWNAMRSGLFAAVDTVVGAFDRDDDHDEEEAARAAARAVVKAAEERAKQRAEHEAAAEVEGEDEAEEGEARDTGTSHFPAEDAAEDEPSDEDDEK